jgi:hypothetical protein
VSAMQILSLFCSFGSGPSRLAMLFTSP